MKYVVTGMDLRLVGDIGNCTTDNNNSIPDDGESTGYQRIPSRSSDHVPCIGCFLPGVITKRWKFGQNKFDDYDEY